jgi:hypothetical protein
MNPQRKIDPEIPPTAREDWVGAFIGAGLRPPAPVEGGMVFHLYRSSVDHSLIVVTDGTSPTRYVNCPNGGRWLKFKSFAETGTRRVDFSEKTAKADIRKRGFHLIHVAPAVSAAE